MNVRKYLALLGLLAVVLAVSCSKKKEEAARLEEEMMQQEVAADTVADTTEIGPETIDVGAIPQEEEPEAVPQYEEGEGYAVQVAACESRDYAQYLVDKYTTRGYQPYLTTVTVDDQTYYRVRIGGLETLQEAKELKDELVDKYSVKAWIDRTE